MEIRIAEECSRPIKWRPIRILCVCSDWVRSLLRLRGLRGLLPVEDGAFFEDLKKTLTVMVRIVTVFARKCEVVRCDTVLN